MKMHRLTLAGAAALALCSCKSLDRAGDAVLNTFRSKEQPAEGAPLPASVNHNTAVMTVEVMGSTRKVVIQLDPAVAPKTVANFKKLVNEGFYNGLAFHRAIHGYLVQTGDPATRSDDNRAAWGLTDAGYKITPETRGKHVRGTLSMARTNAAISAGDRQASGSQFFVILRSETKLDGQYNVFGKVTTGLEVLESIAGMSVDTNDCPTRRFEIKSLRLVPTDSPELRAAGTQGRIKPEREKGAVGRFFDRLW
jgi:cyclophilin family peptidyl-prolyl cis-trans isomerase